MRKKDLSLVERWINQRPWTPSDIDVIVKDGSVEYKPVFRTAKYDEALYNMLGSYVSAGKCFVEWLRENGYEIVRKKK